MSEMKKADLIVSAGREGEKRIEGVCEHGKEKEHEWIERTPHVYNKECEW